MAVEQRVQPAAAAAGELDRNDTKVAATDGRLLRSERTKQAIVDAFLELLRDGAIRPSSAQIAERAGVTQRTLFNQFGDMENLLEAVAAQHINHIAHLLPTATPGPREGRIVEFCERAGRLLDEVMNIRWAIVTSPEGIERFGTRIELLTTILRHQVATAFDPELSPLDPVERDAVLDVLEVEIDPLTWRLRRYQQDLSSEQARDRIARSFRAILPAGA